MPSSKKLRVSVVVPVCNEELFIAACLDAIQNQTVAPYEVIIVDNNCTDKTVTIAKRYNFVKIVKENKQGLSFARNTGIDKAKGEIVARIDADTIIPKDYILQLCRIFTNTQVNAVTGYGVSRFESIPHTSKFWSWCYFTYTNAYFGYPMLWGANLAFRRSYWNKAKVLLFNDDSKHHEDQDLTLALASVGITAERRPELTVSVSMEGVQHFSKFHTYVRMMRYLKHDDATHVRSKLTTRTPKTSMLRRTIYWLYSAWSTYAFYAITICYSAVLAVRAYFTAR